MKQQERKLAVLLTVAQALNRKNITWAVGASLLLFIKRILGDFRDIDIMVAEEDVEKAKSALSTVGTLLPPLPASSKFKSKHFYEFDIDGVDVDLIAGFTVVHQNTDYYFPLSKGNIEEYAMYKDVRIPLQSLDDWRLYYLLMDKPERVQAIDLARKIDGMREE